MTCEDLSMKNNKCISSENVEKLESHAKKATEGNKFVCQNVNSTKWPTATSGRPRASGLSPAPVQMV